MDLIRVIAVLIGAALIILPTSAMVVKDYDNLTYAQVSNLSWQDVSDSISAAEPNDTRLVQSIYVVVLMHIPDIGDTYRQIADTVRDGGYLITVENEDNDSKYFYAKNHGEIFGKLGFRQISFDSNTGFTIRVMRKSPK